MIKRMKKGTLLDTGSKYYIILGASTTRGAKFGLADTRKQIKQIIKSWEIDGLSGEYAIFKNESVGIIESSTDR